MFFKKKKIAKMPGKNHHPLASTVLTTVYYDRCHTYLATNRVRNYKLSVNSRLNQSTLTSQPPLNYTFEI